MVQVAGLEHEDAGGLATGFRNRAGGDGNLSLLEPQNGWDRGVGECRAHDVVAPLSERLVIGTTLGPQRRTLRRPHRVPSVRIVVRETEVSHCGTPRGSDVAPHLATMIIHDTPNRSATMP